MSKVTIFLCLEGVNWVKVQLKMEGIVFLLLVFVMVISVVSLLPFEIMKMIDDPEGFFAFGEFC